VDNFDKLNLALSKLFLIQTEDNQEKVKEIVNILESITI
jgi:hypothetical protein